MDEKMISIGHNVDPTNTDLMFEEIGSLYNGVINTTYLGMYTFNDKTLLLSEINVAQDKDLEGKIDVREVSLANTSSMYCPNKQAPEYDEIASILNEPETLDQIKQGIPMIMTDGYKKLSDNGFDLEEQEPELGSNLSICEIDREEFERIKEQRKAINY